MDLRIYFLRKNDTNSALLWCKFLAWKSGGVKLWTNIMSESLSSSTAPWMIFGTWRSYFISSQIFENKVWCPESKKEEATFTFSSLAYPIDMLYYALFSVAILFHHLFPLFEKIEIQPFILPHNFPAVLIIFTGWGGEPPTSPQCRASIPGW